MSRLTSRGMLGLAWLVPCILALLFLLLSTSSSLAVTMSFCGLGGFSVVCALLLTLLFAVGVYAMRGTLEAQPERRKRDVGRLVLACFFSIGVWGNLIAVARGGEATTGALVVMFLCAFVTLFSLMALLLFAIKGLGDRFRGGKPELNVTPS